MIVSWAGTFLFVAAQCDQIWQIPPLLQIFKNIWQNIYGLFGFGQSFNTLWNNWANFLCCKLPKIENTIRSSGHTGCYCWRNIIERETDVCAQVTSRAAHKCLNWTNSELSKPILSKDFLIASPAAQLWIQYQSWILFWRHYLPTYLPTYLTTYLPT